MAELWTPIITTAGTLVGSFGGYLLAARAQRRAEDRKDARDREAVQLSRAAVLEDERHEIQLKTLMSLQESLRGTARDTFLVIEQDRKALEAVGEYRQLPEDLDAEGFKIGIEFHQSVARVIDDPLREALEDFSSFCSKATLPPANFQSLTRAEALDLQATRYNELARRVDDVGKLLGNRLRAELGREQSGGT